MNGSLPTPLTARERETVNAMLDKARMARMDKDARMDKKDGGKMGPPDGFPDQHLSRIIAALKPRSVVKERKMDKIILRVRKWINCIG